MRKKLVVFFLALFLGSFILESCVTVVHKSRPRKKRPVKRVIILKPKRRR